MASARIDKRWRKVGEWVQPFLDQDEKQVALLPYAAQKVSFKWEVFVGPWAQLRTKQYAVVVTNRRLLLIRQRLSGRLDLEAAYPRLLVTAYLKKGRLFFSHLTLTVPEGAPLRLRVHPVYGDFANQVVAALPAAVGVPG